MLVSILEISLVSCLQFDIPVYDKNLDPSITLNKTIQDL